MARQDAIAKVSDLGGLYLDGLVASERRAASGARRRARAEAERVRPRLAGREDSEEGGQM